MRKFISLSSLFFCTTLCFSQSGKLDPSFGIKGIVTTDMGSPFDNGSAGRQVLVQPGGGIYIIFNNPTFISKRTRDGSIDSSYGFNGYSRSVSFDDAYAALQPDGKIVIAGSGFQIERINTNGMPDSTFGNNGMQTADFDVQSFASAVAIQADGKIVVAGTEINGDTYFAVARYNTDGSRDNTFNSNGQLLTDFGFKSLSMDETDSIPIHMQSATTMGIQADGKIVVGGFAFNGADNDFAVARYNMNGSLDSTFDTDGRQTTNFGDNDNAFTLAIQGDGKIVMAGLSVGPNNNFGMVRYNINGSPDSSFNGTGKQTTNLGSDFETGNSILAIQTNGKIVVAGYTQNGNNSDFAVARFNSNGSIDNTFNNDGILTTDFAAANDFGGSVAIQGDDKIVVAGYSYVNSSGLTVQHLAVSRYNPDGSLDNSFADNGKLEGVSKQGYTNFNATAIQADGKVVAAGYTWNGQDYDFAVARYNTNGSPDSTFNNDGKQTVDFGAADMATSIAIQHDGKIVVAGNSATQFAIARYNTNGSPDNTFSGDGKLVASMGFSDVCQSVALQADGKIVVVGYTYTDTNFDSAYFAIARFNSNGTPDNTFSDDGKQLTDFDSTSSFATSVAIQSDGKIVVAGRSFLNNQDNFSVARYKTDGSLDSTFSHDGKQNNVFGPDDYFAASLAIQNDGKFVVAGSGQTTFPASNSFAVARYKTNGDLDSTFGDNGFQSTNRGIANSVSINTEGKIAVGGNDDNGDNDNFVIALYKNDGSADSSFGINGVQTTSIGIGSSSIQSIAFSDNRLYAAGNGEFPGTFGVVARYLLAESGPLPVSLLDFKAVLENKSVLLQWKIATEKNLATFVIERSADATIFLPINTVPVTGESAFSRDYSIMDVQPLQGINFYRLKMIDADGKFAYSNIVAVKINADNKLRIFPNPARRILFVEANGTNENSIFQIVDGSGRKLQELKVFLTGATSFSIDISNLANGVYNLVLLKKEKTEVQTFIKK